VEVKIKTKTIFSFNGVPKTFIVDNMPFNSWEFNKLAKEWNFVVNHISPSQPQKQWVSRKNCANM